MGVMGVGDSGVRSAAGAGRPRRAGDSSAAEELRAESGGKWGWREGKKSRGCRVCVACACVFDNTTEEQRAAEG